MNARLLLLAAWMTAASTMGQGIFSGGSKSREPVPDAASQKKAMGLVEEVFGAEAAAARTPDAKRAVAEKLLAEASTADDSANRYVLLLSARNMAAGIPDLDLAFRAANALAGSFQTAATDLKLEVLEAAAKKASKTDQYKGVAEAAMALAEKAGSDDDFDNATRLNQLAASSARRSRDAALANRVTAQRRDLDKNERLFRQVQVALKTLETSPADPKANFVVGQYYGFVKGDWERGLPMLALGSDAKLKDLAARDLRGAEDAAAQTALGDGWWALAEDETGTTQSRLQARAAHWYEKALPSLSGLVKAKVEKRLEGIDGKEEREEGPKHYLAPENLKNVAFLTYARNSWKNDGSHLFSVREVEGGYEVDCRGDGASPWKMILFANEDVFTKRLVASFTVEKGECLLSLRPKDLSARGSSVEFDAGERHRVHLWIQQGMAQLLVDGRPRAIPNNDRSTYGFFAFVPTAGTRIVFHDLGFLATQ